MDVDLLRRSSSDGFDSAVASCSGFLALGDFVCFPRTRYNEMGRANGHRIGCGRDRARMSALEGTYGREIAMATLCGDMEWR